MVIRSESDKLLFSGDVLFKDGIGRTDLPTGSVSQMQDSLRELFRLSDDYQVFPGHGDRTTIAEERRNNHYVSLALEGRL
jgi:glyoxylase-like metal-dependent hydrolase (beta-lactamase superfamily II)